MKSIVIFEAFDGIKVIVDTLHIFAHLRKVKIRTTAS